MPKDGLMPKGDSEWKGSDHPNVMKFQTICRIVAPITFIVLITKLLGFW